MFESPSPEPEPEPRPEGGTVGIPKSTKKQKKVTKRIISREVLRK